jgi:uncharacterized membrane protein (UPF0127 family)
LKRPPTLLLLASLALGACACAREPQLAPAVGEQTPAGQRTLVVRAADAPRVAGGPPTVYVEVAHTFDARRRGLSERDGLPRDGGMLFVYPRAEERFFWMRGCLIGLDIAFLAEDGTVLQLETLPPGADKEGRDIPSAESELPVRFVLETAAGWMRANGLDVGSRVDFAEVVDGVDPE